MTVIRSWDALKIGPALFVGLIVGLSPLPAKALEADEIAQILATGRQLMTRIVKVHARAADGRLNLGSGVPIAPQLVATNCHVTRRAESIELLVNSPQGPQTYAVQSQASSLNHDVCVLRVAEPLPFAPMALGMAPAVGEAVVAIGFTGGAGIRIHAGEVLALHAYEGAQVIQSSTAFNSGASGGGLFTRAGQLVGLVTFRSRHGEPQFFSAPTKWIQTIAATQAFEPIAPLLTGRAFWEQTADELPSFLKRIAPNESPAARLGQAGSN